MRSRSLLLFIGAAVAVAAGAVVVHLFGPEFAKEIHGGKLWPW